MKLGRHAFATDPGRKRRQNHGLGGQVGASHLTLDDWAELDLGVEQATHVRSDA